MRFQTGRFLAHGNPQTLCGWPAALRLLLLRVMQLWLACGQPPLYSCAATRAIVNVAANYSGLLTEWWRWWCRRERLKPLEHGFCEVSVATIVGMTVSTRLHIHRGRVLVGYVPQASANAGIPCTSPHAAKALPACRTTTRTVGKSLLCQACTQREGSVSSTAVSRPFQRKRL